MLLEDLGLMLTSDIPPLDKLRAMRNTRLANADLVYCNAERWSTYNDETKEAWAAYKQKLRDLPATCNPDSPVWPTPPNN